MKKTLLEELKESLSELDLENPLKDFELNTSVLDVDFSMDGLTFLDELTPQEKIRNTTERVKNPSERDGR